MYDPYSCGLLRRQRRGSTMSKSCSTSLSKLIYCVNMDTRMLRLESGRRMCLAVTGDIVQDEQKSDAIEEATVTNKAKTV